MKMSAHLWIIVYPANLKSEILNLKFLPILFKTISMKHFFTLLFIIFFFPSQGQSVRSITIASKPEEVGFSAERLGRIDQLVEGYLKDKSLPGAIVYIVRNGKVAYHKTWGTSNMATNAPLKKDDIFRIASMTKAITSMAVMMLYEEGKFLLDDPISMYIPEFSKPTVLKTFNSKDSTYTTEPAKSEITIRQLLTHSSGIDYAVIGGDAHKAIYAKNKISPGLGNVENSLGAEIKLLAKLPLAHNPGERFTYGLNTDVLGYLVEVLSGMPFDKFLQTRVFDKIGMKDTHFTLPKEKYNRLVTLHEGGDDGTMKPMQGKPMGLDPDYPKVATRYPSGGGGLSSTVEDYAKFLQVFLNKGEYNGVRLLSRKTVELILTDQLHSPVEGEMGLGFGLETETTDYISPASVGTFSWSGAFNTHYWADPKENLIGIIFTNVFNTRHWSIGTRFQVLTYQAIAD
jgi:CubicO group peptidase (beta-lactamase class C family)